jgi:tetratricopeptide (TPR) repeat protein
MNNRPFRPFLVLVAAALLAAVLSGCSAEARKARILSRADGFFQAGQYDKAEIEYKNVLQSHGLDPTAVARLAVIYFDQGRIAPAIQALTRASELQPENAEVRVKLGLAYLAVGRIDDARNAASLALERNPASDDAVMLLAEASQTPKDRAVTRAQLRGLAKQNAAVLSALALLELRENRVKDAEALLTRALELGPKLSAANSLQGAVYLAQKDNARAVAAYAAAAAAAPARSPFRIQLAQFHLQVGEIAAAKKVLEETIKNAPDYIPARMLLAKVLASEKNYDDAIAHMDKVLALDGTHPEALLLSAQLRLAKGEKEKAIITLETATRVYPNAPQAHLSLGSAYLANGEIGKATVSLSQAVALAPDLPAAVIALAELNVRQSNFIPAIVALQQLLKKNPAIAEAQLLLATAFRLQGNLTEALAAYRQLAVVDPKNFPAHLFAGAILMQQGKLAEARTALGKAVELAPDDLTAVDQLITLDLMEKKAPDALRRVNDLVARSPKDGRLQILLARVLSAQADFSGAEAALRKAIELQPDSLDPYLSLVQLLVSTKQQDKALTDLKQAVAKNPKDIRPLMLMATLHEQQKDFASARQAYEQVLVIEPKAAVALNNLAFIYSEHAGDQDKAFEYAQRARDLLPNQWETADTLGWILYKKQQFTRALPLLEEAVAKNPDSAELRYHVGMAYYNTGNEAKSRLALERALELNKTFTGADEAAEALALLKLDPASADAAAKAKLEALAAKRKDDAVLFSLLGQLYEKDGNRDKAMAAYETTLRINPGHVAATLGAVRILRAKGELPKALELAKVARKAAPGDPLIAQALGRLAFDTGDFPAANTALQDAVRQLPNDPEVLFDLAEAAYSVGRVADARTAMGDAVEKSPGFSRAAKAREFLGMIALATDAAQARSSADKVDAALAANPRDVPALMVKGLIAEGQNDADGARKIYFRVLERFPDFSPAKKRLAILFAAKGDDDRKGLELATKAREAFSGDAELARALGIITFRLGSFSRAASLLSESARSRPTDAELFYYLGLAQQQTKDAAAPRSLQKAIDLGLPENLAKEAKKALAPAK